MGSKTSSSIVGQWIKTNLEISNRSSPKEMFLIPFPSPLVFLFIKYSEAKSIAEDPNESACYFNRTMGVRIKLDDLNPLCEGCCDDLIDDYELKIDIESRLDFNFFDYRGDIAQRRGETNIYKEVSFNFLRTLFFLFPN